MVDLKVNPGEKLSEYPYNDGAVGQIPVADGIGGTTFEDAAESAWQAITGASIVTSGTFTVPVTEANFFAFTAGTPLKIKDYDDDYKFAVVRAYAPGTGTVTISGAALRTDTGDITELYVGGPEKILQLDIHIPGSWDIVSTALIEDQANEFLKWQLGRSFLVRADAKTKVQDTGTNAEYNVTIGGVDVITNDMRARNYWDGTVVNIDTDVYGIDFNDVIEVSKTRAGGNQDSSDFTVSLTFVLDRENITYEPASPDPYVQMTIGPILTTWAGLGEGVHTLIPTTYVKNSTGSYLGESWKFTASSQWLRLQAGAYGTYGSSRWVLAFTTSEYVVYSAGADGMVQDRLFLAGHVQGGVTFTWSRGGALWGW